MARQKKLEPGAPRSRTEPAAGLKGAVAVPRAWMLAIAALLVLPWLILAAAHLYGFPRTPPASSAVAPSATPSVGPWGRLVVTPIVIAPPTEYVSRNWGPVEPTLWHVPATTPEEIRTLLSTSGLAGDDIARLLSTARPHRRAGGSVLAPGPDLVRGLAPDVRDRLYLRFANSELNVDQVTAYRFFGTSLAEWLDGLVSPSTRALVEPYIYRHGDFMYFADIESVRTQIPDPAELQRLTKALYRQATMLISLQIDASADIAALAEYWGRGGRRTDIRPLLESVAESQSNRSIDVSHLLPSLAREYVYRYPRITVADAEKPLLSNCLWTALNFFNPTPDDRFLDVQFALEHLKRDYFLVQDRLQLGDIVVFSARDGTLVHVAVYIADDLVFGKNGTTPMAPWSILPIERIKGHYVESSEDWRVTYHRRNGL